MTAKLKTDRISSLADRDCWLDWLTTTPQTWWAWTEHTQTYRHIYTQTDRDSQVPSMSNDKPKPNHTVRPRVTDVCLSHRLCVHARLCVSMPVSQTVCPRATVCLNACLTDCASTCDCVSQCLSHRLCLHMRLLCLNTCLTNCASVLIIFQATSTCCWWNWRSDVVTWIHISLSACKNNSNNNNNNKKAVPMTTRCVLYNMGVLKTLPFKIFQDLDLTWNTAMLSADAENPTLEPNMKWNVSDH